MFAKELAYLNPELVFFYLSGVYADSSVNRKRMWARIKGKNRERIK